MATSEGYVTLNVYEGPDGVSVSVDGFPTDWSDNDVQDWAETLAAQGNRTAARACKLVGRFWIDMKGWTYRDDTRIHATSRCYADH